MSRKLNLGRIAGLQYESLDLTVSDCETREEAERECKDWEKDILNQIQALKEKKKEKALDDKLVENNKSRINEVLF